MNAEPSPPDLPALLASVKARRAFSWEDAEAVLTYAEALVAALRESLHYMENHAKRFHAHAAPLAATIEALLPVVPVVSPQKEKP